MSATATDSVKLGRAFAVEFCRIERWSVTSFKEVNWQWPVEYIKPLAAAMTRRLEPVDVQSGRPTLPLVTLRFTGELEPRAMRGKETVKGKLFRAEAGDLVYSKIDVRNGSIGIVPDTIGPCAWTTEYPIYKVDQRVADAAYLKLVIRSEVFQAKVNALISGASGRKRVEPAVIEALDVPIPPLSAQRAIVAHWQAGMARAAELEAQAQAKVEAAQRGFVEALGIRTREIPKDRSRACALPWDAITTWHGASNLKRLAMGDVRNARYPVMSGGDCLVSVANGCSASPVNRRTGLEVLPISCVTKGFLDLTTRKHVPDKQQYRNAFALRAGDVLICRTNGTLAYVGMSALVEQDHPDLIYPDKVIRLRPNDRVSPRYLWLVLQTPPLRAQIEAAARTAVGNYAIGGGDVWDFEFPIPPRTVQEKLAANLIEAKLAAGKMREEALALRTKVKAEVEGMVMGTKSTA